MANNRLWLVHKPSGHRIMLAKRMFHGWYVRYGVDMTKELDNFFERTEKDSTYSDQDDFTLDFEDDDLRNRDKEKDESA